MPRCRHIRPARPIAAASLLAVLLGAGPAWAQYPARAVRMVIPFPAGGPVDVVGRPIAQKLTEAWGQSVVLEARPGAGSIIGSEIVAKAAPDGHTLLLTASQHAINPSVYAKLPYDTLKDFAAVSMVVSGSFLLVVHPSIPARSLKELIALARARPGGLTYASASSGSGNHMSGELLKLLAKIDIVHIPYKGGAPATTDLVGGHVAMMFNNIAGSLPHVQGGRLRALAVTTARRARMLPEVPTMIEAGLREFEVETWFGLYAPAGTPRPVIDRIAADVDRALKLSDVRERLLATGSEPEGGAPERLAKVTAADMQKWAKVAKASGAKVD